MIEIRDLFKDTDVGIPDSISERARVKIAEYPGVFDGNTVLLLTKRAGGERRKVEAISECPLAVVCEEDDDAEVFNCPIIRTKNTRRTLAYSYSNFYGIDYGKFKIIAVTGTNGKSSVCKMIAHILTAAGKKVGLIGTGVISIDGKVISDRFYSMTTPDPSVLYSSIKEMEEAGCTHIVMEASSHALKLEKLSPIKFDIGIFTNLAHDHADFHVDTSDYYGAKASLFRNCKTGIFNLDDKYSALCYKDANCRKISVGVLNKADAYATDIIFHGLDGTEFFYREKGMIFKMPLHLPGAFNVYNSLMALKCAIELGVPPCEAKRSLAELRSIDGRMEVIKGGVNVVIDYAHTPEAFENALKTLKSYIISGQKLTVVFGCGGERDRSKRPGIGRACARFADNLIITEDNSRGEDPDMIFADIVRGLPKECSYRIIPNRERAIREAVFSSKDGDTVAVLGKGHEKYIIGKEGVKDFNEREIIDRALQEREDRLCT